MNTGASKSTINITNTHSTCVIIAYRHACTQTARYVLQYNGLLVDKCLVCSLVHLFLRTVRLIIMKVVDTARNMVYIAAATQDTL